MHTLIGVLAVVVAVQYVVIAVAVVPRLLALASDRSLLLRVAGAAAGLFFLGCATTHVLIARDAFVGTHDEMERATDTVHLVSHVAQVVGGFVFLVVVLRGLVITVVPKDVAEKLRETQERLDDALNAASMATWELDLDRRQVTLDRSAFADPATAVSVWSWADVRATVEEPHRDEVDAALSAALETSRFEVEAPFSPPGDDATPRWLSLQGRVRRGRDGRPTSIVGTAVDVTARRAADEQRQSLERQLLQAQKMEAIGRLAGGVAHDFNNLLMVINGHRELAAIRVAGGNGDPAVTAHLDAIGAAGERAAALTAQLTNISRQRPPIDVGTVDVNAAISTATALLARVIGEDVALVVDPSPEPLVVEAEPERLEQIVMNLALNARDAMPEGGRLLVRTEAVDLDPLATRAVGHLEPGPYACITVSDTGNGMPADVVERLFEPFFTTKEHGTGLGLSIVYGIARSAGGDVHVYSEPGAGSTFRVYLPRARRVVDRSPEPEAREVGPPAVRERVLLVEDHDVSRSLIEEMLRTLGHEVTAVGKPDEVTADLVAACTVMLTDVLLPGMTGPEVAERALRQRPELRVAFMSGHTQSVTTADRRLIERASFVAKPFTLSQLAAALADAR